MMMIVLVDKPLNTTIKTKLIRVLHKLNLKYFCKLFVVYQLKWLMCHMLKVTYKCLKGYIEHTALNCHIFIVFAISILIRRWTGLTIANASFISMSTEQIIKPNHLCIISSPKI